MKVVFNNYNKLIKKKEILTDINLTFESGKIYGLHGHNGSGKTMLLRAICGLILPTSGSVTVDGKTVGKDIEFPDSVGVIIENMSLIPEYTGFKNLQLLAGIKKKIGDSEIRDTLISVGLDPDDKRKVKEYSLGMKQKLNFAQAIMEKPELLLLDEPTNAMDVQTVEKVRSILAEMKEKGTLIIIASHNKEDLDALCDEFIDICDGKIQK
ncbi:MAG: ABC transporter ATP-binding protein [Eubacterium sp.]|nr:ABC transporter ATP-binding protein [Oscillospiraceae bacterium]MDD6355553.1 ABC transporter ATP-binding protein [Oscillospiraceae bacterium]MDY4608626.1 ABC transporter ATP-binding protein [Eubacterium sp.]